jgi:hypothetical protein
MKKLLYVCIFALLLVISSAFALVNFTQNSDFKLTRIRRQMYLQMVNILTGLNNKDLREQYLLSEVMKLEYI